MHLSFTQTERSAHDNAHLIARLLNIPAPYAAGLLVFLHDWALRKARDRDFSGVIHAKSPREMVALALHWPLTESARLWDALEMFGFVQSADAPGNVHGRDRVRGLDRYARTYEKNHRTSRKPHDGTNPANDGADDGTNPPNDGAQEVDRDRDKDKETTTLLSDDRRESARRRRTPSRRSANGTNPAETPHSTGGNPADDAAMTADTVPSSGANGADDGTNPPNDGAHGGVHDGTNPAGHPAMTAPGTLLAVAPAPRARPEDLQTAWNELRAPEQPRWIEMSDARRKLCAVRLRERPLDGPTGWRAVIRAIAESPFCKGDNDRGWRASPEFLLKADTAARALEGQYQHHERPQDPRVGRLRAEDSAKRMEPEGEVDLWALSSNG